MSYGITISRGFPWSDDGSHKPILLEEWKAVIATSENLSAIAEMRGMNPKTGEEIVVQTPNSAQLGVGMTLSWSDGYITSVHEDELLPFYREIAVALGAEVFGEEGERY